MRSVLRAVPLWIWPTLIMAVLLWYAAARFPLWGDEAETALYARSILQTGIPFSWDGHNAIAVRDGLASDTRLVAVMIPWPQLYLTAASFLIFGESTAAARAPFILLSVLLVPLAYVTYRRLGFSAPVSAGTLWFLAVLVPFLLFQYQARYYPMSVACGILLVYLLTFIRPPRIVAVLLPLAAAGALLTHYLSACLLLIALGGITVTGYRTDPVWRSKLTGLLVGIGVWGATLPFIQPFSGHAGFGPSLSWDRLASAAGTIVQSWIRSGALSVLAVPLAAIRIIHRVPLTAPEKYVLKLVSIYIILLLLFNSVINSHLNMLDIRYHTLLFPWIAVLGTALLAAVWRHRQGVGFLLCCLGMALFLPAPGGIRVYLLDLIGGTAARTDTTEWAVPEFLNRFARDGETVFVDHDQAHDPLMLYVAPQLRYVNRLRPDNPQVRANPWLPAYIHSFHTAPDWIIRYGIGQDARRFRRETFPLGLDPSVRREDYLEIRLPVFSRQTTRPEIDAHMFYRTAAAVEDHIYIYRRWR